jgi:hypothetical protein
MDVALPAPPPPLPPNAAACAQHRSASRSPRDAAPYLAVHSRGRSVPAALSFALGFLFASSLLLPWTPAPDPPARQGNQVAPGSGAAPAGQMTSPSSPASGFETGRPCEPSLEASRRSTACVARLGPRSQGRSVPAALSFALGFLFASSLLPLPRMPAPDPAARQEVGAAPPLNDSGGAGAASARGRTRAVESDWKSAPSRLRHAAGLTWA